MNLEDRLRDALRAEGARHHPHDGLLARIGARVDVQRRRRRRPRLVLAAGGVTAAVAMMLVFFATREPDRSARTLRTGPARGATTTTTTSTPERAVTPTTAVPTPAEPDSMVAVKGNDVVVVSTQDGRVLRRLYDGPGSSVVVGLTATEDGRTVFFTTSDATDGYRVWESDAAGGAPRRVGSGCNAFVSPDGTQLGWIDGCTGDLVVRDRRTGSERKWARGEDWVDRDLLGAAFTHDGHDLLVSAALPESPGELFRFDPYKDATLSASRRLGPPEGGAAGTGWYSPTVGGADGIALAVQSCCALDASSSNGGSALVEFDARTGHVRRSFAKDVDVTAADYDATGRHLLAVSESSVVYRQTESGDFAVVARGYSLAVW